MLFLRLMRLHQPTGIWLLLWPCWWALALASHGVPPAGLLALFGIGAIVMRAAGCIVNDIIDRDFDRHVERTRTRPLASGEVTLTQALAGLTALLAVALVIALHMRPVVLWLAAASLILVAGYPFMKRITWWPQAFLGLTFNWGALMGWAAVTNRIALPAVLLYIGGVFWTLGYDTIYAHQDKKDDIKIGVKSTALRLGANSQAWIAGFYALALAWWVAAGIADREGGLYFAGMALVALHLAWQVHRVKLDDAADCMRTFRSNRWLGWLLMGGIIGGKLF